MKTYVLFIKYQERRQARMTKQDLEHKLLMGSELYIGSIPTYRITLGDMAAFPYGYSCCQQLIGLLCLREANLPSLPQSGRTLSPWEFLTARLYAEADSIAASSSESSLFLTQSLPSFLEMLFHQKTSFHYETSRFYIGAGKHSALLDGRNYPMLQQILRERNCLSDSGLSDEEENPDSEMAKMLLDKRRRLREKVKRLKTNEAGESELTMHDLISIFAEAAHMAPEYVYKNYDVYQFNNQFNRLKIMEDYQVNIKALLAGAKSEDIDLKHWLSPIY